MAIAKCQERAFAWAREGKWKWKNYVTPTYVYEFESYVTGAGNVSLH